ncbi:hypothetical protein [Synechococcus elongatus]|uniref:DUF304 domain-containing protein n=1 Tax=Synechococcus elongatus PCC 11802 TaxID=2283154 RepID=A0AAU6R6F4_SYNEL|nr:hypothetical protein [Synechococcus elongatus]QFZ91504.1 hypothetical protein EKO22_03100 [Synechococcus elongatus PCC 11802]
MSSGLKIPPQLRQKIDRELDLREEILWIGQPEPSLMILTGGTLAIALFAVPWTAFSVFWMWAALGFQVPDLSRGFQPQYLFAMFGIPFFLIGIGMLLSPFWSWRQAFQTVYIITNQRAITFEGAGKTVIRSYYPQQFNNLYRKEGNNGIGDVIIAAETTRDSDGDRQRRELGFFNIRDPKEVEVILKKLAQEKHSS